jgi:hypothetical protein
MANSSSLLKRKKRKIWGDQRKRDGWGVVGVRMDIILVVGK